MQRPELPDAETAGVSRHSGQNPAPCRRRFPARIGTHGVIVGPPPPPRLAPDRPATALRRIRKRAGLDNVRIHDLRCSFASRALALGEGLTMIGKLLGHTQVQTTARITGSIG